MNKLLLFFAPAALLLAYGVVANNFDPTRQANSQLYQQGFETQTRQAAEQAAATAAANLAQQRHQQGCLHSPTRILAGSFYQGADGHPLPNGTAICDDFGTTAVLENGQAVNLAVLSHSPTGAESNVNDNQQLSPQN